MMIEWLNNNDRRAYALIRNKLVHEGDSPTLREINEVTGKSSPRSAILTLERLEKAGLITRTPGNKVKLTSESFTQNASVATVDVPLVGEVAGGAPILAEENIEAMIPVSTAFAKHGSKYFLLRVIGESMNQAEVNGISIEDKSIVLVRQQPTADNGDIVVALINDEATVKIFEKTKGAVILRPKSSKKSYKPIVLSESCFIQGVVVAVLPKDLY